MPYSNNPGSGEDLYGDGDSPAAAADKGEEMDHKGEEGEEHKDEGEVALLPKSILAGKTFNVGDEVILKVVGFHEDQVEVAYAWGDEKEEKGGEEPASEPAEMPAGGGGGGGMYD